MRNATFITLFGAAVSTFNLSDEEATDSFLLSRPSRSKVNFGNRHCRSFYFFSGKLRSRLDIITPNVNATGTHCTETVSHPSRGALNHLCERE